MHHSQKHAIPPWARAIWAVLATALVAGLALAPTPAAAVDDPFAEYNVNAVADDSRSIGRCWFAVEKYDAATGMVTGRLSAGVQPKSLLVALSNKYTQLDCALFAPNGAFLANLFVSANASRIPQQSKRVVVPLSNGYQLCASVATITGSGQIYENSRCESSS